MNSNKEWITAEEMEKLTLKAIGSRSMEDIELSQWLAKKNDYLDHELFLSGLSYEVQEKYEEAISSYKKCIESNPQYLTAYQHIGNSYVRLEEHDKAIATYTNIIKTFETWNLATTYYNLGITYLRVGKEKQARYSFHKSIYHDPSYYLPYSELTKLYAKSEEHERNILFVERIHNIFARDADYLNDIIAQLLNLAQQQRQQDKNSNADIYLNLCEKILTDSMEKFPGDANLHYNQACLYSLTNKKSKALDSLKQAIKLKADLTETAKEDADLNNIRDMPAFQKLLE